MIRTAAWWRLVGWVVALGPVIVLAAVHLPYPFGGDQAMFVWGARELADGARIYVDFWDMKQPGIFWFCQIAGSLFGFNEIGIHFGELLWMTLLAAMLVRLAVRHVTHPLLPWMAPLVCLGPYYAVTGHTYLTMVEVLVNLPLVAFVHLLVIPASGEQDLVRRNVIAGVMVALVAIFKLVLVLVPGAILGTMLAMRLLSRQVSARELLTHTVLPIAGGFAVGIGLAALYLATQDALAAAWWASVVYPPLAINEFPHKSPEQLVRAIGWWWERVWIFVLLGPAALIGEGRVRRLPLLAACIAWLVAGAVAIWMQVLSRWIYHMTLLLVPAGIIGLLGIDGLAELARDRARRGIAGAVTLAVIGLPLIVGVVRPIVDGLMYSLWSRELWKAASLTEFQARVEPKLNGLRASTEFLLSPDALPGRIALLGDPRIVLITDRRPVTAINGWTYYLSAQLDEVADALHRERPPYVYVSWYVAHIWRNRNESVYRVLQSDYERIADDTVDGSWFQRR